jgi:DNA invertase Pin-like site-specific DNA recombinase
MSKEIIESKGGTILKDAEDVFDDILLKCKNGHSFNLLSNDIVMGEWCKECTEDTRLDDKLTELRLPFVKNHCVGKYEYQYAIITKTRKFVIFDNETNRDKLCSNARSNEFNIIIIDDYDKDNMKSLIWNSIKDNKDFTIIETVKQKEYEETCSLTKAMENDKEDTGSMIKYAPPPFPINTSKAVGYIRVSTAMQVQDGFSLDAQEAKIYRECVNRNLFCRGLYIDRGISGGSTQKRLGLQEMMAGLTEGDWVITSSVSRLARDTVDLLSLSKKIEDMGCHLVVIDLNLDLTTPSGKLILTLMGSQAQFERELTSERVKTVMAHLKEKGMLRTKPTYGWKLNPNRGENEPMHIRDEHEQETIKRIRAIRNIHPDKKITVFTRIVNESKLAPPRKAKEWYHGTLKDIMKREGIK